MSAEKKLMEYLSSTLKGDELKSYTEKEMNRLQTELAGTKDPEEREKIKRHMETLSKLAVTANDFESEYAELPTSGFTGIW